MVTVENLAFGYVPGVSIMRDVSFSVGTGEFIAVGGRNGCGKTTITRLLMGLEKPQEGRIYYDGTDVTNTPPSARGRYIGYVFQQPDRQMFRATVADEVAFGPQQLGYTKDEVKAITEKALDATGIAHLAKSYPPLLRRGEKQRVAIASALAMNSKILILDEPTSGQDGKETKELMELLTSLQQEGLTIMLVTHDMAIMAEYCTRVIVMGYGTKAFDGTPQELFTQRDDLFELGLTKPPCVELAEAVPGIGYCKSMTEFEAKLTALYKA